MASEWKCEMCGKNMSGPWSGDGEYSTTPDGVGLCNSCCQKRSSEKESVSQDVKSDTTRPDSFRFEIERSNPLFIQMWSGETGIPVNLTEFDVKITFPRVSYQQAKEIQAFLEDYIGVKR
jgi:hypothetical protein